MSVHTWRCPRPALLSLACVGVALAGCKKGTTMDQVEDTVPAIIEHCGTIGEAETWSASSIHLLTCDVVVEGFLTIEPGVEVQAEAGTAMIVAGGVLEAQGTSDEPLLFTSAQSFPVAGDWVGLVGQDGVVQLAWTTVRYAGSDGGIVHLEGGAASLSNVLLSNGDNQGLYAEDVEFDLLEELEVSYVSVPAVIPWPAAGLLTGLYVDQVDVRAVRLLGDLLEEPVGLAALHVPYLSDGLAVVGDGTLWVESGAALALSGDVEISNGGSIVIRGSGNTDATVRGWEDARFTITIQEDAELADIRLASIEGGSVVSAIADLSFRTTSMSDAPSVALTITGGVDTEVYSQLSGCTFAGDGAGLVVPLEVLPYVGDNDYSGSDFDGVVIAGGSIGSDLTVESWPEAALKVDGEIRVEAGDLVLTGGTLPFVVDAALVVEGGSLHAEDTVFTHLDETSGGWLGITLASGAGSSTIERCEIAFGGQVDGANITVETSSKVQIEESSIRRSAGWGIYLASGTNVALLENTFEGNAQGDVGP